MTKPQSPRSRPAGAARAASEGRDGRSFFSRPKGDARAPIARDSARDDRSGGTRDERSGGRPTPRPSYDAPRGEGRGGERGAYGADRREGRPSPRPSFDPTRGEGRGERASYGSERHEGRPGPRPSYDASRGEGRGGERGSYGSERREGRPGPRPSYDAPRGEGRGGERGSYGSERREGRTGPRPSYDAPRGEGRGGERASYGSERREGRQDARPSHGSPRGGERGQYAGPRGGEGGHGQGYGGQDRPPKPQFNRPRLSHAAIRIDQVQRVLGEILQWTYPADAALSHWLRNHPNLGARDRSEVAEAVYDVLRHLRRYRQFGESGVGPASRRLAILGLAATLGANELSEGMDAAEAEWLQRVSQIDLATLPRAVRGSIPDWLDERLGAMDSPDTLIEALNRQASLDLRVNPLKVERDAMLAELQQGAGRYEPVAMRYSPWGIRMEGRPAINRWPQFENGSIEVQDEGSQLLALLVGPRRGEMIIDFCAGAGGKTLLLGALMRSTGRLYAFDVSAARLARAKPRFARSGLSNVVPVVIDSENDARVKRLAGKAQRVLVDAPCSGIGTLRRNPDLKWRQHPEALAELGQLQERILNSAARCVAPGGRLVYATCSLLAEENEVQAERFLASHPDFERLDAAEILAARCENLKLDGPYVQLRPDVHGTDGFFAAVFERRKKGAAAGADDAQAAETSEVAPQEPAGETPAGDQDQPA
ncbi:Ribosomal RNA small subunit methyltransferase B [Achromobacter insolitus]|uniref:Ribosomal RNA small subunit methyltransferase B n=1 Tax=Achromobacter insolitus TaxID=217204 RepID=A0A6S7F7T3_9BURK|nr:RsmB/NOP family class I SAM-dependent RNA methyltransferase [Achromobacter insolitus]CAB3936783.1 Ribosomal RNA small subunit methyltransferase B [Achromobacter insolitus]CAB3946380.1 Ribosomal RNA small subunit methyltransferase B [Achromobacter insolitus]